MKKEMKIIILCSWIWMNFFGTLHGQIRSDFILVDQGSNPCIVLNREGHLYATWECLDGIYYALFDSLGSPITDIRKIQNSDRRPSLAVNKEYAVIAWLKGTIFDQSYIMCNTFSINFLPVSKSVIFNDYGKPPDICFLNDSLFIVVWCSNGLPEVYGQISNTSLQLIGGNILLSDHGSRRADNPRITVDYGEARVLRLSENSDFIVIWWDDHLGNKKIFGRIFDSDGVSKDSSFLVSENLDLSNVWFLNAAIDTSGDFVVVWGGAIDGVWQVQWRWFKNNGIPITSTEQITNETDSVIRSTDIDVATDSYGNGVIVWEKRENDYSKIYAQRFLPDKTLLGKNFRVSVATDNSNQYSPNVALYNNKIYTAWTSYPSKKIMANIIDFDHPPTQVKSKPTIVPKFMKLHQNYPNPFNLNTIIKYEVSQISHVNLTIYNLIGEKIVTLKNKEVMPGIYKENWNTKNLEGEDVPSGIYLYRLTIGTNIQTKKMVLVR